MEEKKVKFSRSFSSKRENFVDIEKDVLARIEEIKKGECIIGKGKTAEVFVCEKDPWLCFKIISTSYYPRLNVDQEMKFMDRAIQLGIRTPKPLFCMNHGGMEVLAMERVNGYTVKEIIEGNLDLPSDFDLEIFFQELSKFIEKMHNNRIYHRDFHEGNVMIDKNGKPWIIDFGDARFAFSEEEAYSSSFVNPNTRKMETMKYTSDNNNLAAMWYSLRKYVLGKRKKS